jgi:hypothetical protein
VRLRPAAQPQLPLGRTLTFGQGWHLRPEGGVRWGEDRAVLSYFNPGDRPITVNLRFELQSVSPREIRVEQGRQPIGAVRVTAAPAILALPGLRLPPGVTVFRLISSEPAIRQGTGRNQLRAIGLRDWAIEVVAAAGAAD